MERRAGAGLIAGMLLLGACTGTEAVTGGGAGDDAANVTSERAAAPSVAASGSAPATSPNATASATTGGRDVAGEHAGTDASGRDGAGDTRAGPDSDSARDGATGVRPQQARPAPSPVGTDDRGRAVETLQRRLAALGFAPGPVDGAYGPRTEAAVEAFQMIAGLKRSGQANARTVAALQDYESDVKVLQAGDTGRAVEKLQRRLAKGPFDPGPVDGSYGPKTVQAVWALEKLVGVPVDGNWGPLDEHALARLEAGKAGGPKRRHQQRWVEFDLSQQVMTVYDPGAATPVLVSHGSSGNGIPWENEGHSGTSVTPPGDFVISRRIAGWRESSLDIGRLYNPLYFNGGIAFHGATSVPLYPASHGCVRLPMHIAEYLPSKLPDGTPVHVLP